MSRASDLAENSPGLPSCHAVRMCEEFFKREHSQFVDNAWLDVEDGLSSFGPDEPVLVASPALEPEGRISPRVQSHQVPAAPFA